MFSYSPFSTPTWLPVFSAALVPPLPHAGLWIVVAACVQALVSLTSFVSPPSFAFIF